MKTKKTKLNALANIVRALKKTKPETTVKVNKFYSSEIPNWSTVYIVVPYLGSGELKMLSKLKFHINTIQANSNGELLIDTSSIF